MTVTALGWILAILILAQGAFLAWRPDLAIRHSLWKTRLIGAQVAHPGRGTLIFYRAQGIAAVAVGLFIIFSLTSE